MSSWVIHKLKWVRFAMGVTPDETAQMMLADKALFLRQSQSRLHPTGVWEDSCDVSERSCYIFKTAWKSWTRQVHPQHSEVWLHPTPRASPSLTLAMTWVKWLLRSSYLCPSVFPTPKEPLLEETHLVSRTKQGDQKIMDAEAWWKKKKKIVKC